MTKYNITADANADFIAPYSEENLSIINETIDRIQSEVCGIISDDEMSAYMGNAIDAIHSKWFDGASVEDLI